MKKKIIILILLTILLISILISKHIIENFKLYENENKNIVLNKKKNKPCKFDHLVLTKNNLYDLKDLLINFIYFADKNKIDYFSIGGTLIGSVRHGGLIPFDDDIDLGILALYNNISSIENYSDNNYYFEEVFFGYKFKKKNSNMFIDIMVFEYKDKEYQILTNFWPESAFKNINEIFPLKKMKFNDIFINVPNEYKIYLDRNYPNWDKEIIIDCGHHIKQECINVKNNIPNKFNVDYENSKFLCYSEF